MHILVTGSSGHLGEALVRTLRADGCAVRGVDVRASSFTDAVGSIADRAFVRACMQGIDAVLHTATLHKPHVATHSKQQFVDTNITGTLNLLEEAAAAGVSAFVFTSTTSVYGLAMHPPAGAPAVWVDEALVPQPKNIYGVTKLAAENLCELFARTTALPCLVLRTSRFFPEDDDHRATRDAYAADNIKTNEFLYRRVDIEDLVAAHRCAIARAPELRCGRYVISATTPFAHADLAELRRDAPAVVQRCAPGHVDVYARLGWRMQPAIERVYDNARARRELGWQPRHDFASVLQRLRDDADPRSPLAQAIGAKGYHDRAFDDGPYPVE